MLTNDVIDWLMVSIVNGHDANEMMPLKALKQLGHASHAVDPEQMLPIGMTHSRSCYLVFEKDSKSVSASMKPPPVGVGDGRIVVKVNVKIPTSLFETHQLTAKITLPEGGVSEEVIADLASAIGMSYGQKVQLTVEPSP